MKKKILILLSLFLIILLAGCTKTSTVDETESTKKEDVKEEEKETNDNNDKSTNEEAEEPEKEEEAEEELEEEPVITGKQIQIFYPNENGDEMLEETISIESLTPDNIMKALSDKGVLPDGIRALNVNLEPGDVENGMQVNFTTSFQDYMGTMGSAGERVILKSVVDTFLGAYGKGQILILVEGNPLQTGHGVYDSYLSVGSL
ncbi:hypothetical protein M2454_001108 [Aequitasia blattaphilus]|uniref:GerMN domain-containing protein n=1 Tax=Aequitasia blattaphilus TaxID=2949332 RepID=A0ABT1E6I7_9FIRM|nr:GerMN domain-containing protein [Aequitasia blattaphilus]MCP1101373.1 GerMN domain-containing protein [Aequitasia blattaphilus]MCR8614013.1 GerMN domain-containing protein [Aequitasia blattaphilus]